MIKKNIKLISVFVLGVICAISITFAYSVSSKNITMRSNDWNVKNVEEAVDYLKDKNKCTGIYPKIAKLISGNKNTVGSVVRIGDEDFYIIGEGTGAETGKTKLLSKYCINNSTNKQVSQSAPTFPFSATSYWTNKIGEGLDYPGSYSGNPYPYIYDENSGLYPMVNAYVQKLSNLGINGLTGRLMSYEEASPLSNSIRKTGDFYWTGSAKSDSDPWRVDNSGTLYAQWGYNGLLAIRPVILIPTNEIGN